MILVQGVMQVRDLSAMCDAVSDLSARCDAVRDLSTRWDAGK